MRLFLVVPLLGLATPAAATPDPLPWLGDPTPFASSQRAQLWPLVRAEAQRLGVPPSLADAVAIVETGYTPGSVGSSGEIGMMQVMPSTARMLGFAGDMQTLFDPATNIHYGVTYLARAWAASGGDACRALMKYRAGTGEDGFSPLSIQYCRRAAAWLRGQDADLARNVASHTPLVATLTDPVGLSVNGHPFHVDLAAIGEIAGVPGLVVEPGPSFARSSIRAPATSPTQAVRGWHVTSRGHIQAVIDAALRDGDDGHEVHIGDAEP